MDIPHEHLLADEWAPHELQQHLANAHDRERTDDLPALEAEHDDVHQENDAEPVTWPQRVST